MMFEVKSRHYIYHTTNATFGDFFGSVVKWDKIYEKPKEIQGLLPRPSKLYKRLYSKSLALYIYLNSCECSNYGWWSKPMRDQREVSQVTLDGRIQDLRRSSVAERGSVLVQQVHQLLDDHPAMKTDLVLGCFVNLAFSLPFSCLPAILFSVERTGWLKP